MPTIRGRALRPFAKLSRNDSATSNLLIRAPPIAIIPEDVLYEIFLVYLAGFPDPFEALSNHSAYSERIISSLQSTYEKHRLVVTHVCRLWREVAHQSPRFWATIHASQSEMASRITSRFAHLTFNAHIYTNSCHGDTLDPLRSLMKHAGRFKRLQLGLPPVFLGEIEDLVPQTFPSLTSLSLVNPWVRGYSEEQWVGSARDIPASWRSCQLPALKELRLMGYRISPFPANLFLPQLTHLHLEAYRSDTSQNPWISLRQALAIIRRLPELVSLTLKRCIEDREVEDLPHSNNPADHVTLRHLQTLHVEEAKPVCIRFMEFLVIPSSTSVHLRGLSLGFIEFFINKPTAEGLARPLPRSAAISGGLMCTSPEPFRQDDVQKRITHVANTHPGSFIIGISTRLEPAKVLGKLISTLSLEHVEDLFIDADLIRRLKAQAHLVFPHLPRVVNLHILGVFGAHRIIISSTDPETPYAEKQIFFPNLRHLRIIPLARERKLSDAPATGLRDAYISLALAVEERRKMGYCLDSFTVQDTYLAPLWRKTSTQEAEEGFHAVLGADRMPTLERWQQLHEILRRTPSKADFFSYESDEDNVAGERLSSYPWYGGGGSSSSLNFDVVPGSDKWMETAHFRV